MTRATRHVHIAVVTLFGVLLLPTVSLAQTCTTQIIGDEDFFAISGSSDTNVIAVGKKGTIYRYDGTAWTAMSSPTNQELFDVEVVDGSTAFAVGKKGEILELSGGVWSRHLGVTDKELNAVWAASASEVYVAGKNGVLFVYNGSTWSDQSAAAGVNGKEQQDAWGDSASAYVLGDDGILYRYDRTAGSWDAPDTTCDVAKGFTDLWGDGSGDIYLTRKKEVYRHDGSSCSVVATAGENLEGIYGSAAGEIYAVGKKGTVMQFDGASWQETTQTNEDLFDVWVSASGTVYYAGKKSELTICAYSAPQFTIIHDNFGIRCLNETITVDVIDANSGVPLPSYSGSVTLDTQVGRGTWQLLSGAGVFSDAVADDGLASYDWPLGETRAVFSLSYPEGPESFDIDVFQTDNTAIRDSDAEGSMVFSASGFTLTAAPLSNPPPAIITPFGATQTAAVDFAVYITAYGQTPNDPQCGVIESYTGSKALKFWSSYLNPGSGFMTMDIDAAAIASNEAGTVAQNVVFTNGQAAVTARYDDVGLLQILVKDDTTINVDLPTGIRGATAGFVVQPADFLLSGIRAGATVNPQAADANGPVFVAAGADFEVTVTAVDAEGDPTPNYGRESTAEGVRLNVNLLAPGGGSAPPVSAAVGFGAFAGGTATGFDFTWPEVGIIELVPGVGDGDYLGSADVTGTPSERIGRFVPDHFAVATNTPMFQTACVAGNFTYLGQSFNYLVNPVITLTAQAVGNTTTLNYTAAFFKLDTPFMQNRIYQPAQGSLDLSGLPLVADDPTVVPTGLGVGTATFSGGTGLVFDRLAPVDPFNADIDLSIDVFDADGVTAMGTTVTFASIPFSAGANMRYGRVALNNAVGSERVNLAVPMTAQYFAGSGIGFVTHVEDSCSANITLSFGTFTENLGPGDTCVLDSGSPGDSNEGCAAPAPLAVRYNEPPVAGDFSLNLQAPNGNNNGSLIIQAVVPAWLTFDWVTATPGEENPTGQATFGIFQGNSQQIYLREVY